MATSLRLVVRRLPMRIDSNRIGSLTLGSSTTAEPCLPPHPNSRTATCSMRSRRHLTARLSKATSSKRMLCYAMRRIRQQWLQPNGHAVPANGMPPIKFHCALSQQDNLIVSTVSTRATVARLIATAYPVLGVAPIVMRRVRSALM